MALILNIETSTEVCSVALACDSTVINFRENIEGQNHAKLLAVYVNEVLEESQISMEQIDSVAVSGGPGSYTGLRIGVSLAKGICYASNLPMIAITSLEAMANQVINNSTNLHLLQTNNVLFRFQNIQFDNH